MTKRLILCSAVMALVLVVNAQVKVKHLQRGVAPVTLADLNSVPDTLPIDESNLLFFPLVYDKQEQPAPDTVQLNYKLAVDSKWLTEVIDNARREDSIRRELMIASPELVHYNAENLPEPPKQYVIAADPSHSLIVVEEIVPTPPVQTDVIPEVKNVRNWLHSFDGSLHFTQAYVSDNWYQGGYNNISILGDVKWDVELNPNIHPKLTFKNSVHYRVGVMTSHNDEFRKYTFNEDNFQLNSSLGYKAIKRWYYSANLQFKTQIFNKYKENTEELTASFLSPAELNIGLGMTYSYENTDKSRKFSLALNPLSYNLKYCRDIERLDPTSFGINEGHHSKHDFGSSINADMKWKFNAYITWSSQLDMFTNYRYFQTNWQNTFDFYITRHLSTQIYTHLRFDRTHPRHDKWGYFQFRETLSFGLTYRFATN